MATLVLTAVGSLVGGPIGGAIGAVLGQGVDQRLLAPKARQGPRLGDLSVQTSTYGSAIPKLFGTMRVAGTVIWATDLREARETSGGGKGRPGTTSYSYSASFAVALSGRPVRAVHRVWADGKLLRGEAGDWKSDIGDFRLLMGDENQAADPLIVAAEGPAGTPAYRGIAYAVFEDLQLADFGNRIPSLTFEVEADEGAVELGALARDLSEGEVTGQAGVSLLGYAASGDSVRSAIEALAALAPVSLSDDGSVLRLNVAGAPAMLAATELGGDAGGDRQPRVHLERRAAGTLPDEVAISYYEPARDYQAGLQRARRGGPGRRVESADLPAALPAAEAKAAAERRLSRAWAERLGATVRLPPRHMELRPGGTVTLPGEAGAFRISSWTLEHMVLELKLLALPPAPGALPDANAGRATAQPDDVAGATLLTLLDLPPLDDRVATSPRMWIAAAGTGAGWRRAQLLASLDGGTSYQALGTTALPAVIGIVQDVLAGGEPAQFDDRVTIDVVLGNTSMWLESRSDDALVSGANLAALGDELIQFGTAEPLGERRFRLGRLLRGRRGTEAAMATHVAGERFVLLDPAALLPFDAPVAAIGGTVRVLAAGLGDVAGVTAEATLAGRALRPPSPVHLTASRLEDGTIRIVWVRRSRVGWAWLDGGDAPLGEESERYRLTLQPSVGSPRTVETGQPRYDYAPDEQATDGATGAASIDLAVIQIGSVAPSLAATAHIVL